MRRPLAVACLLFCAALAVYLALAAPAPFPAKLWEGESICVTGQVYDREYTQYGVILYLNNISWNTSFQISNKTDHEQQEQKKPDQEPECAPPRGILCRFQSGAYQGNTASNGSFADGGWPEIGQTVRVRGIWKPLREATNPGEFDERSYYAVRGLEAQLTDSAVLAVGGRADRIAKRLETVRGTMEAKLYDAMGEKDASVLAAMLLGSKRNMDREVKSLYQASGIAHILAISGLHISLLGRGLYRLLTGLGMHRKRAVPLCVLCLYAYAAMTGMGPSSGRAVLMFLLQMGASATGRSYDMLTALAVAAAVLLTGQPLYWRDCGFQLSFGAVMGIAVLTPVIRQWGGVTAGTPQKSGRGLGGVCAALRRSLAEGFWMNTGILLVTLPILIQNFYVIPVYSIFLNLMIVPLMSLLLPAGMLVIAAPSGVAQLPAACVCGLVLTVYERLCTVFLRLPGSRLCIGHVAGWRVLVYYGLLLLLVAGHRRLQRAAAAAGVFAALLFLVYRVPAAPLQIHMLDVGQGDCFLVQTDGTNLLIDGGSSSKSRTGTYQIQPALSYYGVSELSYVFVSHLDSDHYSGIKELLQQGAAENRNCTVRRLVLPENVLDDREAQELSALVREQGGNVYGMRAGQRIVAGKLTVACCHPLAGEKADDPNDTSLVLRLSYGQFDGLFPGDLSAAHEAELIKAQPDMRATLLKAGHHGSRTSTGEALLAAVKPRLILLSCGRNNRYGHPHPEAVERMEASGAAIFTTAQSGAVTVCSDGKSCWVLEYRARGEP